MKSPFSFAQKSRQAEPMRSGSTQTTGRAADNISSRPPKNNEAAKEDSSEKTNPLRLVLLCGAALFFFIKFFVSGESAAQTADQAKYASADSYIEEVTSTLQATDCHYPDAAQAAAKLGELPASIASWQQTARVEPSEILRSLVRIERITACSHLESQPSMQLVAELRRDLATDLEDAIRSGFARLRRAQKSGDRPGALANVHKLQNLLRHHKGPLRGHLDHLERLYRPD